MKRKKAISVTLPAEVVDAIYRLSKKEMKSVSALVGEAVQTYGIKREIEHMREGFSERARRKGIVSTEDIDRVIHEYRKERADDKNKR